VKKAKSSDGFAAFVEDQLSDLDALVMKRMFGGTGLYLDGVFFGLIYQDRLYFRVSDETIAEYRKRKVKPFKPFAAKSGARPVRRSAAREGGRYYEVPLEILENPVDLVRWAKQAAK
jgi:DNA transformation protein